MGKDIDKIILNDVDMNQTDTFMNYNHMFKRTYYSISKILISLSVRRVSKYKQEYHLKKRFDKDAVEIHKQFNRK